MAKLSIIIPTFNSGATIERCLASIASQTFSDYEIIIQDGGSRDNTIDLIRNWEKTNAEVDLKLRQEKDKGIYDAMNKAVLWASGEWLYFLGSDDELHDPHVLQTVMGSEAARSSNVIYGNVKCVGSARRVSSIRTGRFNFLRLLSTSMCHQAIFYRAAFAREIGQYNNNYVIFADWDYNMRCWSKTRFSFLNVIVANYSVDGFSGQGRIDPLFDAEVTANILRYFNLSGPLKWIALSRIHSAYKAETAFSLRGRGAAGYLGAMTSSILQWPFGDVNRYKVWIHMLLTRLGIIPEKRVPADRPK